MTHHLFTIGHSAMECGVFLKLLQKFEIKLVMDVRSRPRSQRYPQFDEVELDGTLREAGIRYLLQGEELGGRPEDPKEYRNDGLVDYCARRKSRGFAVGMERVLAELESGDLALMCAEEDPLSCHRFLMICPELVAAGIAPLHIRKGGILETQHAAEDRLLNLHKMAAVAGESLFPEDRQVALESAYVEQSKKYGFRIDARELEMW